MKAIVLNEAGGADKLIYQDIEKPTLKSGEILIKVKNIGMNPMDVLIRASEQMLTMFMGSERPAILGWDISGDIVDKAADVTDFEIGDAVFGAPNGKGYAEYVATKTDRFAHKPPTTSYQEAAALPIAGITAWEALVVSGKVKKGDKVLIHAGAGGVGHIAIQLAKHLGATVIATSSAKNKDFILSLGADQHIDYTNEKFYDVVSDIDFALDSIGGDTRDHSIDVVKKGGIVVSIVPFAFEAAQKKAEEKGVNLIIQRGAGNKEEMNALADLLEKGIIKPHVTAVYPFGEMKDAHHAIESKHTAGKIIVEI
jgi:NADPH:quinone reductase-like Zn-dependent oxidoreductase